jgi:hypothetical protein
MHRDNFAFTFTFIRSVHCYGMRNLIGSLVKEEIANHTKEVTIGVLRKYNYSASQVTLYIVQAALQKENSVYVMSEFPSAFEYRKYVENKI